MATVELERLIEVVKRLRDPEKGCPWDSVQTQMSIRRYLVEETGEYLDALEAGNWEAVRDELGDLLLQVVLNAQIAADEGRFCLEDVARGEADKMIRRHPHVFGESKARTEEELRTQWDAIKSRESGYSDRKTVMDGVPRNMPALARAQKMLSKMSRAGMDWSQEDMDRQLDESYARIKAGDKMEDAIAGLLMAAVGLCRKNELQAEELMQQAIKDFSEKA